MASLVYDSQLNVILEDLISSAKEQIVFFSPYFKLHDRLKDCLKLRREDYNLRIVIVFGKNEDDPSKSLSKDDFEFLTSFPNIVIAYEKRLHAKYYANEKNGLLTSLNLHSFSQNNNIEAGVYFKTKSLLKSLSDKTLGSITSVLSDTEDIATEAGEFFYKVYSNSDIIFENQPQFDSKFLGLQKKYSGSKILVNQSSNFFGRYNSTKVSANSTISTEYYKDRNTTQKTEVFYSPHKSSGYCIRTAASIAFNPAKPLSRDAYQSWAQFENPDYQERYCHSCGRQSNVSVRNPLCFECVNQSKR